MHGANGIQLLKSLGYIDENSVISRLLAHLSGKATIVTDIFEIFQDKILFTVLIRYKKQFDKGLSEAQIGDEIKKELLCPDFENLFIRSARKHNGGYYFVLIPANENPKFTITLLVMLESDELKEFLFERSIVPWLKRIGVNLPNVIFLDR